MSRKKTWDVIIEWDVTVPMRDSVNLVADLYFPAADGRPLEGKLPAVLQRTPYKKESYENMGSFFAKHGYLSVVQDCRGRFKSGGDFFPFRDEPQDGYDTVVWLANHPSCNGKVGMYGCSHMAWVQFHAATQNPPGLATIIPYEGPINAYHYSMRAGGALHLGLLKWILETAATSQEAQQNPAIAEAVRTMSSGQNFLNWASRIPWKRGQTPLSIASKYEDAAFQLYFENYDYTDFWRQPGFAMDEYFECFPEIPILWVVGWYDWYPRTIIDGYQKMVKMQRENQYLLVGPWTHNNFNSLCGDVNFGTGGSIHNYDDFLNLELAWFDRWLKDDQNADIGTPVKVFTMGGGDERRDNNGKLKHSGKWHYGDIWPPKGIQLTPFYLHPAGALAQEKPSQESACTTYTYDPRNTVSSNGRCIIPYGPAAEGGFSGMGPRDQIDLETLPGHGIPGMPIASRPDVLVFQTQPLSEKARIAGNIKVILWVSSNAPDTDFFVKLIDLYPPSSDYPTSYAFPVSEGILRARYREGWETSKPMEPGKIYQIEIPLEPSANLFAVNHRIRVDICSSNFPNFDINRNTGDPNDKRWRIAENSVYHEMNHTSCIVLPIHPIGS